MKGNWPTYYFLIFCAFTVWTCDVSTDEPPPNLILIIADDMAWDDCGAYGHPSIQTPNIDRLAREGMKFTNAFLTTNSCSPSRASIITGKYPHQTDAEQLHWPLPADQVTFVEQLKEAGYWTGQAGKWHLGDAVKDRFDLVLAEGTGGFVYKEGEDNNKITTAEDGSGCQNWLPLLESRPVGQPFFLWLAAVDPHRPYLPGTIARPHQPEEVRLPPYLPDRIEVRSDFAAYYDEIGRMDDYIGKLLRALEEQQISENTVVLFISDNGRAFPREKTTLYDGGIKTPWIVRWPAQITSGTTTAALVSSVDIAPTFLKLAGLEVGEDWIGEDFTPILGDASTAIRDFIYAEDHWHDFEDFGRAIRDTSFKYIKNYYPDLPNTPSADALRSSTFQKMLVMRQDDELSDDQMACFRQPRPQEELYEVAIDPYELNNLANNPEYGAILAQMRLRLEEIRNRTNDRLPGKRTPDEFERDTGKPTDARIRPRPSKEEMIRRGIIER